MKKYIFNIIITAMSLSLMSSCSKDFLEKPSPTPNYKSNFTSEANAEQAVIGCYDIMV
jgi:hypothetical protein